MQNALLLVKQTQACNLTQFRDKSGSIRNMGCQGSIPGLSRPFREWLATYTHDKQYDGDITHRKLLYCSNAERHTDTSTENKGRLNLAAVQANKQIARCFIPSHECYCCVFNDCWDNYEHRGRCQTSDGWRLLGKDSGDNNTGRRWGQQLTHIHSSNAERTDQDGERSTSGPSHDNVYRRQSSVEVVTRHRRVRCRRLAPWTQCTSLHSLKQSDTKCIRHTQREGPQMSLPKNLLSKTSRLLVPRVPKSYSATKRNEMTTACIIAV